MDGFTWEDFNEKEKMSKNAERYDKEDLHEAFGMGKTGWTWDAAFSELTKIKTNSASNIEEVSPPDYELNSGRIKKYPIVQTVKYNVSNVGSEEIEKAANHHAECCNGGSRGSGIIQESFKAGVEWALKQNK